MTDLPEPLTPTDADLRGLPYMPLDVNRLLDSDMFAETTGDELKAALALWCKSWTQVPAGSLPNKELVLAELSRAKNWKKVKAAAMRGWILCSDNRWYHPVVAEKALNALPGREEFNSKRSAEAERKARERDDRKALFELLKSHGVVPEWNVSTKILRSMALQYQSQDLLQHVTDTTRDMSHPVTVCKGEVEKKGKGELTSKDDDDSTDSGSALSSTEPKMPPPPGLDDYAPPPAAPLPMREAPPISQDPAVILSVALRRQGVNCMSTHPVLQDWASKGVTLATITEAISLARETKGNDPIHPNYLAPIVTKLLNPPPATPPGASAPRPPAAPRKPHGMDPKGLDESYDDYNARITAAEAARRKGAQP